MIQALYFGLLKQGVAQFRSTLEEVFPFAHDWRITQGNFANLAEMTRNPDISFRAKYYLYCFGYLISIEGSYSNWIKILYRIVCEIHGLPDDSSTIIDWKPWKVEEKLIKIHSGFALLFEGYHGGKLRNAIGHGDFSYIEESEKMRFHHVWQGNVKFDEEWTFEEFYENLAKVMTVSDTGLEILWLLRLLSYGHLLPKDAGA